MTHHLSHIPHLPKCIIGNLVKKSEIFFKNDNPIEFDPQTL